MANVSEFRQYATSRFIQQRFELESELLNPEASNWLKSVAAVLARQEDSFMYAGTIVETIALQSFGMKNGYLTWAKQPHFPTEGLKILLSHSKEVERWPATFRRSVVAAIQTPFGSPGYGTQASSHPGLADQFPNSESFAVFQSTLLILSEFSEPNVWVLQRELHAETSLLDHEPLVPSSDEVWSGLIASPRHGERVNRTLAVCVGGMIRLLDILDSFDYLFRDYARDEQIQFFPAILSGGNNEESRIHVNDLSGIIAWRLNLDDPGVLRRLSVVTDAFWAVCHELGANPERGLKWNSPKSKKAVVEMFTRWRNRTYPEFNQRPLDELGR